LSWPSVIAQSRGVFVASLGGALLGFMNVPGGWLSGAMVATAILSATRWSVLLANPLVYVAMIASGVTTGSAMTPQMAKGFAAYPVSLALMALAMVVITATGAVLLRRLTGWSRITALFAAVPGALSYVFSVAATTKADLPRIAIVQVMRTFFLMAVVPIIVAQSGASLAPPDFGIADPLIIVASLFCFGALAGFGLERLGLPGGMLFGAMIVSGLAHVGGFAPGHLPPWIVALNQILIGAWAGSRFVGFDWSLLANSAAASIGSFCVTLLIAVGFAAAATHVLAIPFGEALVAFSPGGLEAMTVLSFALGLDPLYVGVHHLARFILISLALPFIGRFARENKT
jgi:membrane AbrB-like protein